LCGFFIKQANSTKINVRKMGRKRVSGLAFYLRNIARYSLLVVGILVFIFALLSGSEAYGGGVMGIIKNSPNALPWLGLLVFLFIAWKRELIGGLLITALGIFLMIFFNILGGSFQWPAFIVSLIPVVFGLMFILSWYLAKSRR
jgi:hypothetical protein